MYEKQEKEAKPDIPYLERLMAQPVLSDEARQFLFDERRLSHKVIKELGISSISYPCPMSSSPRPSYFDGPALLIPYRDIDGKLMSVQSRYLGQIRTDKGNAPKESFFVHTQIKLHVSTKLSLSYALSTDCSSVLETVLLVGELVEPFLHPRLQP